MACSIIRNKQTNEIEQVLAPNGKESNLYKEILKVNPDKEAALRMWAQVYTPSFKSWFGDWEKGQGSKVVDENGEPLLVYHGTDQKFDEFKKGITTNGKSLGQGFYFSSDKKAVEKFANISDLDKEMFTAKELTEYIKPVFLSIKNENEGVINKNEYVVFEPNQIKSVFNQGTFSEDSNNIYFQLNKKKLPAAQEKLDNQLLTFLSQFGVTSKEVNDFKKRFNIDALGATDVMQKLIYLSSRRNIETVPEEAAHMMVMLMGKDSPLIKEGFKDIENWSGYAAVKKKYMPIYKDENKVKVEALGHLIRDAVVNKYTSENPIEKSLFEKIRNIIESFFKGIRNLFNIKRNNELVYDKQAVMKIADALLTGDNSLITSQISFNYSNNVNYYEALEKDSLAKEIVKEYTEELPFKLVGSLAIAKQTNIDRWKGEQIHDLDFKVSQEWIDKNGENFFDKLVDKPNIVKLREIHNEYSSYHTKSYLQAPKGYRIEAKRDFISSAAPMMDINVYDEKGNKLSVLESLDKVKTLDFFIGGDNEQINFENVASWQDIFQGKLSLSSLGEKEVMFDRTKDQTDYIKVKPVNLQESKEKNVYLQKEKQSEKQSSKEIDDKVKDFLASIGVNIKVLDSVKDRNGNKIDAIAKADMLNKIIQVAQGKADITTLSEEASHFFVEMLGENNPIYKEMFDKITGYKIYTATVNEYKDLKMYRNEDGTINFTKLKKEAMAKLIMAYIIKQETGEEVSDKLNTAKKWWAKLWDFVKKVFNIVSINPFESAAKSITTGDISELDINKQLSDEEFLQKSTQASKVNSEAKLLQEQDDMTLDDSIDPSTGEKRHVYNRKGVNIVDKEGNSRSVNSVIVNEWYKQRFPTDNRSDRQKMIDKLKAEEGTKIHADMEDIIKRYFNKDGTRKATIDTNKKITTNAEIYGSLEKYFTQLLEQYKDPKTKFLSEVRVYDSERNIAGTIDLVVLLPDGSVDIYDWKSQEIGKDQDELKWFKAPAYRIQMEEYKKILQKEYGFSKFNKIRAIPIKTTFVYTKDAGGLNLRNIKDIEIGNADPRKIPNDKNYLLPVVMLYESTGDKNLDTLVEKLNAIYDILRDQKVKPAEKDIKAEELNELAKTIRDLQVRKDINSFIDNGLYELDKFSTMLSKNTITIANVQDAINTMKVYAESQDFLQDQLKEIKNQIEKTNEPDVKNFLKDLREKFLEMQANSRYVFNKLIERRDKLGDEYAKTEGINTLLDPQKSMDWLKRNFRSISTLDNPSMQTFYKVLRRAQTIREQNVKRMIDEIEKISKEYKEWATAQGKSGTDMFSYLLQYDDKGNWNGDFLNIYNKDYFTERNKAIKNNDFNWFKLNTTFDKAAYDQARQDQIEMLEERYPGDNEKIKQKRDKLLLKWEEKYDNKYEFAYLNKYNTFIKPLDKWHSDKYKFIYQKNSKGEFVNKPLKDAYEYFQSMVRHSAQLGMIDKYSSKFIPTMVPGLEFNPSKILDSLRVNSNSGFGNIDVLTGERKKEIPVMMTRDIGVEKDGFTDYSGKSTDLFKVFGTWGVQMYNYEAMSDIEDIADMLLEIEKGKNSYAENQYGKINKEKQINTNKVNTETLQNHINYYLYGQETSQNIDKAIEIRGKEYSAVKTAKKALKYMALKTLGLNFLSGTSTFVGGTGNAYLLASKRTLFTEKEWIKGIKDFSSKDKVTVAAIYQFGLSLEDETNHKLRNLSVDGAMNHLNSDSLMWVQRKGDKWATFPISATLLNTYMIDQKGNVISIRDYVKAKNNYENFYNLPIDQQKSLRDKMEKEVEDLQKTKSLKATAEIKDGKLNIPGMTDNIENITRFKGIVTKTIKSIIGNATRDDMNQIRMTLAGSIIMQFRTWMPQMITERAGDMSYDVDMETWNYGKARLFFKHVFNEQGLPLIKELVTGFGTNTIDKAKARYIEFLGRLKAEGKINDDSEFMTESEFIDMYIGNLRSMMRELMMILAFGSLVFWSVGGKGPDDDEDKTGVRKWVSKAFKKYFSEFAFYYSPGEFTSILKSPIPLVGLLTDTESFLQDTFGQGVGFALSDEQIMKKNHPLKYLFKIFPVTKELQSNYALINNEFSKDWDIR